MTTAGSDVGLKNTSERQGRESVGWMERGILMLLRKSLGVVLLGVAVALRGVQLWMWIDKRWERMWIDKRGERK